MYVFYFPYPFFDTLLQCPSLVTKEVSRVYLVCLAADRAMPESTSAVACGIFRNPNESQPRIPGLCRCNTMVTPMCQCRRCVAHNTCSSDYRAKAKRAAAPPINPNPTIGVAAALEPVVDVADAADVPKADVTSADADAISELEAPLLTASQISPASVMSSEYLG